MTHRYGWFGIAFVAGVLIAAALISLPPSTWAPARIAAFYHANAAAIVAIQLVGLLAVLPFVLLLRGIHRGPCARPGQAIPSWPARAPRWRLPTC